MIEDDAIDFVGTYLSKIETAETSDALALVGHEIKAARTWSADERAELEAAYRARFAELKNNQVEPVPEADDVSRTGDAEQTEPPKKAPSKKAQARYVDGLVQALADSTDSTACENLIKTADGYVANNLITKEAADEFRDKAVAKMKTFLI